MAVKNGYNPQPGQQAPQKYPFVGANYQKYGEQPGYVYYPWKDEYYVDPNAAKQWGQQTGSIPPDPKDPSLSDTILPIAAAGGALALGQALGKDFSGTVGGITEGIGKLGGFLGIGGKTTAATATTQGANAALAPAASGIPAAPNVLGASRLGTEAPAGLLGMPSWLASGDPLSGTAGGVLPYAGAALGAYGLYNQFTNPSSNKFGSAAQGAASGAAIGSVIPGVGTAIGAGVGGLLGLGSSFLAHESTRDVAKKHTSQLLNKGKDDPQWQGYVSGMRQQHSEPPPDPSKPFLGGKYSTFDEYKAAGLNATDLSGVYGNLETYGPEWAKLSQQQREAVTQANINSGLYSSKKGEVVITDKNQAKKNLEQALGRAQQPPPGQTTRPATITPPNTKPNGLLSVGAR